MFAVCRESVVSGSFGHATHRTHTNMYRNMPCTAGVPTTQRAHFLEIELIYSSNYLILYYSCICPVCVWGHAEHGMRLHVFACVNVFLERLLRFGSRVYTTWMLLSIIQYSHTFDGDECLFVFHETYISEKLFPQRCLLPNRKCKEKKTNV